MVSLSHEPSFLPGFDPDIGSEVHSKMFKATMMITKRDRTLSEEPTERTTD
jgi:hypothetical protein